MTVNLKPSKLTSVVLSPNALFEAIESGDDNVEFKAFVDDVTDPKIVGKNNLTLMKFILNNGSGCRVSCVIWGEKLINKHKPNIVLNQMLHIDAAYVKSMQMSYAKEAANLIPFEVTIVERTKITVLGMRSSSTSAAACSATKVTFKNVAESSGLITIEGHIKTKFEMASSHYNSSSYGCGAITDGVHKITIKITRFTPINLEKGVFVEVTGQLQPFGGILTILCPDSSSIVPKLEVKKMDEEKLILGCRVFKRSLTSSGEN